VHCSLNESRAEGETERGSRSEREREEQEEEEEEEESLELLLVALGFLLGSRRMMLLLLSPRRWDLV